jgi:GNAT superfamily N-acetyltransferase
MAKSHLELADIELRVLFQQDGEGRLLAVNERDFPPPPLVALARTAEGDIVRTAASTPPDLADRVSAALDELPAWRRGEPTAALPDLLAAATGPGARAVCWHGPAFVIRGPLFPGGAMQIYPANAHLLHPALATLAPELSHRRPTFAVIRGGQAVSVCYSARGSREAAEAGVETAPEHRGQGCAALAVEAWADAIHATGRLAFYSTGWENAASIAVARKLDLQQYAELAWVTAAP